MDEPKYVMICNPLVPRNARYYLGQIGSTGVVTIVAHCTCLQVAERLLSELSGKPLSGRK